MTIRLDTALLSAWVYGERFRGSVADAGAQPLRPRAVAARRASASPASATSTDAFTILFMLPRIPAEMTPMPDEHSARDR